MAIDRRHDIGAGTADLKPDRQSVHIRVGVRRAF